LAPEATVETVLAVWYPKADDEPTALMKPSESCRVSKSWCCGLRPLRGRVNTTVRFLFVTVSEMTVTLGFSTTPAAWSARARSVTFPSPSTVIV